MVFHYTLITEIEWTVISILPAVMQFLLQLFTLRIAGAYWENSFSVGPFANICSLLALSLMFVAC